MVDTQEQRYKSEVVHFLNYLDHGQRVWHKDNVIPQARFDQLTAADVMRYFNHRVYNTQEPNEDSVPRFRYFTILNWKKSISHFIRNKHRPWNDISNTGNPTQSGDMLRLLKQVQQQQVGGRGRPSKVRNPFTATQLSALIDHLREHDHPVKKYGGPALQAFQLHVMSGVDCASKWKMNMLSRHHLYPSIALKAKLDWTKNTMDERDAPWRIILGARNPRFCTILNVGLWLELHLDASPMARESPYVFSFKEDNSVPQSALKAKRAFQSWLLAFIRVNMGGIFPNGNYGTYSARKFASTHAVNSGASRDEKEIRACWRTQKRVSNLDDHTKLPYPDAKVAAMLCLGGAITYEVGNNIVTKDWIIQHVTPRIFARTNDEYIAFVFGKAILWSVFAADDDDEDGLPPVPPNLRGRIMTAYGALQNAQAGDPNPIVRKTILIGRPNANGNVMITIREPVQQGDGNVDDNGDGGAGGGNQVSTLLQQQCLQLMQQLQTDQQQLIAQVRAVQSDVRALQSDVRAVQSEQRQLRDEVAQMRNLEVGNPPGGDPPVPPPNLPALPNGPPGNDAAPVVGDDNYATLSHGPPTLQALWQEWTTGINGRKPAKDFTPRERGKVKHVYSNRRKVWTRIALLLRRNQNWTSEQACARLYEVFGLHCTVSAVIKGIKEREKRGNEPGGLPEDLRLS